MDQHTITGYRHARDRTDLTLAPGERIVAGGTWFFGKPQTDTTGIVDISDIGWPSTEVLPDGGLRVAATCTIAELADFASQPWWDPHWSAGPLFAQCADALLASWKIWQVATVGGNICRSYAAASMVSLAAALDGEALLWSPDGTQRRARVAELITGDGTNNLGAGEVLRAIDFPAYALRSRTGFRKIALAELGRSGAVVTGRVDEDGVSTFAVTAATLTPTVMRYPRLPQIDRLYADVTAADGYYTDPQGRADWRRAVSAVLATEIRHELATGIGA